MKLHAKLNLILIVVFVVSLVPTGFILRSLLRSNARSQVIQNARIMMETAMAMRGYTVTQVRPLLADQMSETFLPQTVPAYSATEIFNSLRENHPEYTYKEATLNPTNPRNRALIGRQISSMNFGAMTVSKKLLASARRRWAGLFI